MKTFSSFKRTPVCLLAAALLGAGGMASAGAATALLAQIDTRPVTPSDLKDYALTGAQGASGLSTVAIGEPVYLEAQVNLAIPPSDIVGVNWSLTSKPSGSVAVLTNSPLGSNVPIYKPTDRLVLQVAQPNGRVLLRPDVTGQYVVTATITTTTEGVTNVTATITAGTWMGINTCSLCHSGGLVAQNKVTPWLGTLHATKFTRGINGQIAGYGSGCISCHTVGYDTNTNAVNGGFDDIATQLGWTFPTVLTNSNWANMQSNYPSLANLANIQCENCHGPGSEHAYALGNTNRISVTYNPGDCGQCHDAKTHHVKNPEWYNSKHAITTRDPSGPGHEVCVGCHTAMGFVGRIEGWSTTNTAYEAISCAACHDPHDASNPHQLRTVGPVTLLDGTTVANEGTSELCISCHHSRQNATNYVETASGSTYFGPHEGPQADMLLGVNGVTYGKTIPSSAHATSVTNLCVTCHMQSTASTDPGFLKAGGHTFSMSCTNGGTNVEMIAVCTQCHGSINTFNFAREDYNGDGIIEGVQTEVQHLLDQLALLLPPVGQPKADISINSSWTRQQLRAAYNYRFVQKDGSHGVHNAAYAVGLLKASIADLSGTSVAGGLPDWWVNQYFGSTTNANAAPTACPAGDGIPNWLKYALGLNPLVPGTVLTNGVVLANVTALGDSTNTVHIYTAAEVAFDTQLGSTYQVQGISSLSGGWQNIGGSITGTGAAISYLTPTRNNVQQFFRVIHNP